MRDADAIRRDLAEHALTVQYEDLPPPAVENTRRRLFDMVGCAIGGSGLDDVRALADTLGAPTDEGATGIGFGRSFPVQDAALLNCVAGRSFDWGPLTLIVDGERVPSHISETSVLTGLAVGEHLGVTGEELLAAITVGDDLAARIWLAAGDRPMPGSGAGAVSAFEQWGTVTTFASATIAGRLFGLTQDELEEALALGVSMMSGAGHGLWDGAASFKLSQGASARNGILAARLAAAGWTGIDEPLFGDGGYYGVFETGCDAPELLLENLGENFNLEVCFKPYPGGRPTDAPIEAAIALAREEDIEPAEVAELMVRPRALPGHYAKPFEPDDYPTGHALFSFKYAAASALVRGRAGNAEYTPDAVGDPTVRDLIDRTTLEAIERELDSWGAEVVVRTVTGEERSRFVPVPQGDPPNPMSTDALVEKFRGQARFAGTFEDVEGLIERLLGIEGEDTVREVAGMARDET